MPQSIKSTKDERNQTPDNYQPLPNIEAIAHFNGKTLLTSQSYLDVKAYEHALAFTVAGMADEDLLKDVRNAIQSALEKGEDFATFKQRLKPYLMSKGWLTETLDNGKQQLVAGSNRRLRTIYSTNLQTAYSAGQWERIQKTKEFLPYLQYMPSVSENKRLSHRRYYNLVRPVDDEIWQSIMPPNGFGCKCWVKQLTKRQAEKIGISPKTPLATKTHINKKTGEVSDVPVGIDPSFNHNFDRLGALIKLANEKYGTAFSERLKKQVDEFTLDLIFQPDFTRGVKTVAGVEFVSRFNELVKILAQENGSRDNSMELRKKYAKGENYAVATISPSIQKALDSQTAIVWLSDDTVIKMLVHHPELDPIKDLLPLFKDTQMILKNAVRIIKEKELSVVYYSVNSNYYKVAIKTTNNRQELYLTTIFKMDEKEFHKDIARQEKKGKEILDGR